MNEKNYRDFIAATVIRLKEIRDNPTPSKVENILIDLQALTLNQGDDRLERTERALDTYSKALFELQDRHDELVIVAKELRAFRHRRDCADIPRDLVKALGRLDGVLQKELKPSEH